MSARIERLPITRKLAMIRVVIGTATFFDAYTVLAIAFAMPVLSREWQLAPSQVGMILSFGYLGQLVGAVFFGWLAERIGRLWVLLLTMLLFVGMDIACLFAWSAWSMSGFRFIQGTGTGGEVPVASAYINEFIAAKRRGRFFLLYEVIFPIGLLSARIAGYFLVPVYGWRAMFLVGLVPAVLMIPLRWGLPESPRWLAAKGRLDEADAIVSALERAAAKSGQARRARNHPNSGSKEPRTDWRELFQGIYLTIAYAILQTIAFSLYLCSAELYPTHLSALGTGCGSAWLRLGSSSGPLFVGWIVANYGVGYVFAVFAGILLAAAVITGLFAIETKGRALEQLSP